MEVLGGWGDNYGSALGFSTSGSDVPVEFSLPSEIGGLENIKKISVKTWQRSFIITNNGEFYLTGTWNNTSYDGGHVSKNEYTKYTHNLDENVKIIDVAKIDDINAMLLTNEGQLYGWGREKFLGINKQREDYQETGLIPNISNIVQIIAGNQFYIAIDKDGKVYGTGNNKYGILGRWIGVDRNSPNSRYKTAFEWVECPELEI